MMDFRPKAYLLYYVKSIHQFFLTFLPARRHLNLERRHEKEDTMANVDTDKICHCINCQNILKKELK
jgi:hypothetical protein